MFRYVQFIERAVTAEVSSGQIRAQSTPISPAAVREGANAYLKRQLSTVAVLFVILIALLYVTKAIQDGAGGSPARDSPFAFGRARAFAMGAIFLATVGFVGMRPAI